MGTKPIGLTIAGSDSGGGAGIQADIKSMEANGVFATSVLTALTAQNTREVRAVFEVPTDFIAAQIDTVFDDFAVGVVKTGMLSSSSIIDVVAGRLVARASGVPLVVDPVMISKGGYPLLAASAVDALIARLLPLADVVTPNAHEATALTGVSVVDESSAREAARILVDRGPRAALVKGGHVNAGDEVLDVLFDGSDFSVFRAARIDTQNTHGTGCTTASAIAANLAKGHDLVEAISRTRRYISGAIAGALSIGGGHGPTDHFYAFKGSGWFPMDDGSAGS
ncbi:MAG: bifunctional hydroxymethylpyrimidine kinase/phosphomethylpyrimidine kinase [Myxococcota bacterium]